MTEKKLEPNRQAILDAERAINERYQEAIKRKLDEQPGLIKQMAISQSQIWTSSSLPRPKIDHTATTALIGRVALDEDLPETEMLGEDIYIAGWHLEFDGFETVNWAAPVASLFFEGRHSNDPAAPFVSGRRTFVQRRNDLVDYSDEIETGISYPFEKQALDLEIPAAPVSRKTEAERTKQERKPTSPEPDSPDETPTDAPSDKSENAPVNQLEGRLRGIRAAEAVARVIQQPKQGRMGAVLPTMQPDQYQLVSSPSDQGLIVQGQPGTGKTVIAAHRAAFLTSEWRSSERIARVAIIGPSDSYVAHIRPILSELKEPDADIPVQSLPDLLRSISGLRSYPKPGPIGRIESGWDLGRAIDKFVRSMPNRPESGPMERRVRQVTESLKHANGSNVADAEILAWLQALPDWNEISAQVRYLPMLATIALALNPRPASERVGHLIVDEAQDIRPLEWRILISSLLESGGSLSLFGDMNQRRSDWTYSSWGELSENLELTDVDGHSPIHELETGFRSTRQILKFANQLLPSGMRDERSLQDGPQPRVTKVSADGRTSTAFEAAIELTTRHTGMVAVISTEPRQVSLEFRKRGWNRGKQQHSWTLEDATVLVLHPDEARGLEFDASVVVEPGAFPENVGRQGVLYTSLTRANKELTVVHTRRLPRNLRAPR